MMGMRGPKPRHDWPTHLAVWLEQMMREEPIRLRDIAELTESAMDHLEEKLGWAPLDNRVVRAKILKLLNRGGSIPTSAYDVTTAERQLIDCVRIIQTRSVETCAQITIERRDGAWEIAMSEESKDLGRKIGARGVGSTFDQAWLRMDPMWA